MNGYARLVAALAAVLVVGVVGFNLLPAAGGVGGAAATPSLSPTHTPSPSPTLESVTGWPTGDLEAGHHYAAMRPCDPVGQPRNPATTFFSFDRLFGDTSFYPNTPGSKIQMWFVDLSGEPFTVYADQASPSKDLEQEISQIVDSIAFE